MNARENLIRSVYLLKNMSQNDMEKLVDAYAHELAEEIRQAGGTRGDEFFTEALQHAADLIEPEVE